MEDQDIFIKANKALMEGDYRDHYPLERGYQMGKCRRKDPQRKS
jgi:predicted nucleotidyltransferase